MHLKRSKLGAGGRQSYIFVLGVFCYEVDVVIA